MSVNGRIRNAIVELAKLAVLDKPNVIMATVDSVDVATRTCTCTTISNNTELQLLGVRLMAEVNDGMLIVPSKDSTVIIENTKDYPLIIMYSAIDKVFSVAGGSTFQIDKDGIKLDGDNFNGLVKVKELTDKINAVEKLLNDLINKYNSHTHAGSYPVAGGGGGTAAGTSAVTLAVESQTISPITKQSDIENTKVKHGDGS